ncbi:MAG: hypothetical protein K6E20_05240 [Acholeplasmatales bacterium]|nr:hypothetical protein [Acholeplasmatales bacterium]
MIRVTLKVDGMRCGMCEVHVNEAVRKTVNCKSVKSKHSKNETVFVIDDSLKDKIEDVIDAIQKDGYRVLDKNIELDAKKKGLFW